jgi:RNA polymerase sigma-70 factor (ECF subfamily)
MHRVFKSAWQREFLELLDAHGPTLMAMLRRLCRSAHDAEDVFQETAVRVWRGFADRPRLRNPRGWILTIGYRAFLDTRQRSGRHDDLQDLTDSRQGSPVDVAVQAEDCDRLQVAVAGLAEPIREVIVLHYVGGLTLRQTAAAMEISEGTVKSRLHAALNKLRSVLE